MGKRRNKGQTKVTQQVPAKLSIVKFLNKVVFVHYWRLTHIFTSTNRKKMIRIWKMRLLEKLKALEVVSLDFCKLLYLIY